MGRLGTLLIQAVETLLAAQLAEPMPIILEMPQERGQRLAAVVAAERQRLRHRMVQMVALEEFHLLTHDGALFFA